MGVSFELNLPPRCVTSPCMINKLSLLVNTFTVDSPWSLGRSNLSLAFRPPGALEVNLIAITLSGFETKTS